MRNYAHLLRFITIIFVIFFAFSAELNISQRVHEVQLKNGMKWLIVRYRGTFCIFGAVMVRVGGLDKTPSVKPGSPICSNTWHSRVRRASAPRLRSGKTVAQDDRRSPVSFERKRGVLKKPDRMKIEQIDLWIKNFEKEADEYRVKNEVWEIRAKRG